MISIEKEIGISEVKVIDLSFDGFFSCQLREHKWPRTGKGSHALVVLKDKARNKEFNTYVGSLISSICSII